MIYAVLCYNNGEMVCGWTREQDDAVMAALSKVHDRWERAGKLKPSIRLLPTSAATTLHKAKDMVIDGPYAETKEALLGFYIIDVADLEEGLAFVVLRFRGGLFGGWVGSRGGSGGRQSGRGV